MRSKLLSSTSLKLIAVVSMFIDHLAAIFYPQLITDKTLYLFMRLIGRFAYPLFAFVLAEGFYYTSNQKKYLTRLFLFALVTEVIFDLSFYGRFIYWGHQNVLFTFSIGILTLKLIKSTNETPLSIIWLVVGAVLAELLRVDYGAFGILMLTLAYFNRDNRLVVMIGIVFLNLLMTGFNFVSLETSIQAFGGLSVLFIYLYNNQKGIPLKYFFYLFYPVHLLLLYIFYLTLSIDWF